MRDNLVADFYRSRAAELRAKAAKAQTPSLMSSYRILAENWERLADEVQQAITRPSLSQN